VAFYPMVLDDCCDIAISRIDPDRPNLNERDGLFTQHGAGFWYSGL
jgi:hypothetical protein